MSSDFDKLKYLQLNKENVNVNVNKKWTRLDPFVFNRLATSTQNVFNIEKLRIIYKSDDISTFLEKFLYIHLMTGKPSGYEFALKFALLIEEQFFDNKLVFNQLDNSWIIPINISLIVRNNRLILNTFTDTFSILDNESKEYYYNTRDYYFEIQTVESAEIISETTFKNNFSTFERDDKEFCYYCEIVNLFGVVWENTPLIIELISYTLDNVVIEKPNFKRVRVFDKEAIIIPIMFKAFSNLKYVIKNSLYVNNYLKLNKTCCLLNFNGKFNYLHNG